MSRVAVVGAGIVGLAAAHALRARGADVTLCEPGPPGGGQSAGRSRIFRHAHDDPRLVALVARSRSLWREWEHEFGVELVSRDGAVAIGDGVEDKLRTLEPFDGIPVRRLDPGELHDRLPLLAGYEGPAMLDVDGGAIRTVAAVGALVSRLEGTMLREHVISVGRRTSGGVEVRTGTTARTFDHVVLCAGRGTAALARGAGIDVPVALGAHVRLTFATRATPARGGTAAAGLPTFQDGSGTFGETGAYGAPDPDGRHFSVGLSADTDAAPDGALADPSELAALADRTVDYVRRALPGLEPAPVDHVHCWVTRLPWGDDGVGIWSADGITALAGHNLFKQAPVLGEALAGTALTGTVPQDLRPGQRLGRAAG
ncbi:NAD(P)/FAD-dependent oxidoreductase [Kocuria sp. M1R5S2]|uniref:NAD(P)/FAD-dependent oxidoreductase n=1 Tax=Kocuria rhizosphaerae TaxID=3376285 RepID=UPI0037873086